MQNKGYTIPELIIVIVIIGIFSIILINKTSYAFENIDNGAKETEKMILIKTAQNYANSILDRVKEEEQYIMGKDLVDAGYLVDSENKYSNIKIKLTYSKESNSVNVEILE